MYTHMHLRTYYHPESRLSAQEGRNENEETIIGGEGAIKNHFCVIKKPIFRYLRMLLIRCHSRVLLTRVLVSLAEKCGSAEAGKSECKTAIVGR